MARRIYERLKILKIYKNHSISLLQCFYPIVRSYEVVEYIQTSKFKRKFIPPMLINVYLILEVGIMLPTIGHDLDNPYLFQHVIVNFLPKLFLIQSDIIFPIAISTSVFFYYNLINDDMPHVGVKMFPITEESKRLTSLDNRGIS